MKHGVNRKKIFHNSSLNMKNKIKHIISFSFVLTCLFPVIRTAAQTLTPFVMPAGGGYATGGGNSLSFTIGEPATTTLSSGGLILSQGEQQPEIDLLTGNISPTDYCTGAGVTVPYTATGYYGSSNIFTAELSNAAGSFASPVTIGSVSGTASGSITAVIPPGTLPGTGYRIRVVSTHPVFTGRENALAVTITNSCCNILLTGTGTNVSCHNGTNGAIDVSSSNTSGIPAFLWSDGNTLQDRNGLAAGAYTVTVTYAAGCSQSQTFIIMQPGPLALNALPANVTCRGAANGNISLAPTGNAGPYSYLWNNGSTLQNRSSLVPGTYTVTVNDAGLCGSVSQTFVITQPAAHLIINTNKTDVRCNGALTGAATAAPGGGTAPYTYSWSTIPAKTTASVTGLAAGVYTCTVTDANDCTKSAVITINQPAAISVLQNQTNVTFPGGNNGTASVSVTGGTPGYTYSWNTVPVKTSASVSGLTAGTYKCNITDSKGCVVKATFIITQPVARAGAVKPDESLHVTVYPNPSAGLVSVMLSGFVDPGQVNAKLIDMAGREVYSRTIMWKNDEAKIFDFTALENGIYHFRIVSANGTVIEKIVIQ